MEEIDIVVVIDVYVKIFGVIIFAKEWRLVYLQFDGSRGVGGDGRRIEDIADDEGSLDDDLFWLGLELRLELQPVERALVEFVEGIVCGV